MSKSAKYFLHIFVFVGLLVVAGFWLWPEKAYQVYTNKFAIESAGGTEIFRIGDDGTMSNYGGDYDLNSALLPAVSKPVAWGMGFELRNSDDQIIFYVENNGNVHLDGTMYQYFNNGNDLNFPEGNNNLIIQNSAGQTIAYINNSGNVYLKDYVVADGDNIVYAFVTADLHDGDFNGISGADDFCSAQAQAAGLNQPDRYRAWLSADADSVASRLNLMDGYQFVLNGTGNRLLANGLPLSTDLLNPLDYDQYGNHITTNLDVFSNTYSDGSTVDGNVDCNNWDGVYGSNGNMGLLDETSSYWTYNPDIGGDNNCYEHRVYCFAQLVGPPA